MSVILCVLVLVAAYMGYRGAKKHQEKINELSFNDLIGGASVSAFRADIPIAQLYAEKFTNDEYRQTVIYDFLEEDLIDLFGADFEADLEFLELFKKERCAWTKKPYTWNAKTWSRRLCSLWMAKDIGLFFSTPEEDRLGYDVGESEFDIYWSLKIYKKIEMYLQKHGHDARFLAWPWFGDDLTGMEALKKHKNLVFESACKNDLRGRDPELFRLWETKTYEKDDALVERERIYEEVRASKWLEMRVPLDIYNYEKEKEKEEAEKEVEGQTNLERYLEVSKDKLLLEKDNNDPENSNLLKEDGMEQIITCADAIKIAVDNLEELLKVNKQNKKRLNDVCYCVDSLIDYSTDYDLTPTLEVTPDEQNNEIKIVLTANTDSHIFKIPFNFLGKGDNVNVR